MACNCHPQCIKRISKVVRYKMLNIPEECRFRVANMDELRAVLEVLEANGYRWGSDVLPTHFIPNNVYGLHIYKGRRILKSHDVAGYDTDPVYPEISINVLLNSGNSVAKVSQNIFALF